MLDPSTTARLLSHVRKVEREAQEDAFRDITDREMDVLLHLAKGRTNAEIASLLNLMMPYFHWVLLIRRTLYAVQPLLRH